MEDPRIHHRREDYWGNVFLGIMTAATAVAIVVIILCA